MKILMTILFILVSCFAYAEKSYDLEASGDHSVWVIVNDVRKGFEKQTGISLNLIPELAIVGKGCSKGISLAENGRPDRDFGLICCKLDDSTIKKHRLKIYPIAMEPLAIIVNKDNPVKGLTMKQVRGIFAGEITNWSEVGGIKEKIVVATQLHCRQFKANWTGIFDDSGKFTKDRVDIKTQPEMAKTVGDFRQAIGHLEMTSVVEASNPKVRVLKINEHLPTSENLKKGLYPLYATLSVATRGEASGKVVTFIDYMRDNPSVAKAMRKYGMHQTK